MRLLVRDANGAFVFTSFIYDDCISSYPYAILSHRWFAAEEEVTYEDIEQGNGRHKLGYKKLEFCANKADVDGLRYFWVDCCCIKKSSDAELSESINSMYRWYKRAKQCYVYLTDVKTNGEHDAGLHAACMGSFRQSEWFTRGWTLQELVAPGLVKFYSIDGVLLGDKISLRQHIHEITSVSLLALEGKSLSEFDPEEIFEWAHGRRTTRPEDWAYCLLGMLDVSLPVVYGEGLEKALARLKNALPRMTDELDRLPIAYDASINAYANQHQPSCLKDTRSTLLDTIHRWAENDHERSIFWLRGMYGTGKSTIARTIARYYSTRKCLGASFFFSRGGGDVGNARKFVTSIAVQLAQNVHGLGSYICNAIVKHSNIASLSLTEQWRLLITRPLLSVRKHGKTPLILVVDALDECDGEDDVQLLIRLMIQTIKERSAIKLRFFLTSRPELHIRYSFSRLLESSYERIRLDDIEKSLVDQDIFHFLEHALAKIAQDFDLEAWPTAASIHLMVNLSTGLFIWAATAVKFIREGRSRFADKRLRILITGGMHDSAASPEQQLDRVYISIIEQSVSSDYSSEERQEIYITLRYVLGSVANVFSPLSKPTFEKLLNISSQELGHTLQGLHSILDVPDNEYSVIRLHHPSFREFLSSEKRSRQANLWVDEAKAHTDLMDCCLKLMSRNLKQDLCGIEHPGMPAVEVKAADVEQNLPGEVQYACIHWVQHLQKSGTKLQDHDPVHQFLNGHFLHWLEALSYLRKVAEGLSAILLLESLATGLACPELLAFLYDAKRFTMANQYVIERWPLQLYLSALVFAPQHSIVRKLSMSKLPKGVHVYNTTEQWSSTLAWLEGHAGVAETIVFSPDNKLLASSAWGNTIGLWDANTGSAIVTLPDHDPPRGPYTFSPDSSVLAATSWNGTIRLWLCTDGVEIARFEEDDREIKCLAYSPCGRWLASGSADSSIRLWNTESGQCELVLNRHSETDAEDPSMGPVTQVIFSADNSRLASAYDHGSVVLWDAKTFREVAILKDHFDPRDVYYPPQIVFSPDGSRLAFAIMENHISLWDSQTGDKVATLEGLQPLLTSLVPLPGSKYLAASLKDSTVRIYDIQTGATISTLGRANERPQIIALSSTTLVTWCGDETIIFWDITSSRILKKYKNGTSIRALTCSPDGKRMASLSAFELGVRLWDVEGSPREERSMVPTVLKLSPDSEILVLSFETNLLLFQTQAKDVGITLWADSSQEICKIIFSSDSERLAASSTDGTIKIWDRTGNALATLKGWPDIFLSSQYLVSVSAEAFISVWDALTGDPCFTWPILDQAFESGKIYESCFAEAAMTTDSRRLTWRMDSKTINVLDLNDIAQFGERVEDLPLIPKQVYGEELSGKIALSPDGERLAAFCDERIGLWNDGGAMIAVMHGHTSGIDTSLVFSPNSERLASASEDKTIRLWNGKTGETIAMLKLDDIFLRVVSFSQDGLHLFTNRGCVRFPVDNPVHSHGTQLPFVAREWIELGNRPWLWLPADYRANNDAVMNRIAVGQKRIVFVHKSGDVIFLDFSPSEV